MASISTSTSNGTRRILFKDADGNRKAISLGKTPVKECQTILRHVEKLVSAKIVGHAPDRETSSWLSEIGEQLRDKLARVGLVEARDNATLKEYTDAYIARRCDVKPRTLINWRRTQSHLLGCFDGNRPLWGFSKADCKDFRQYLLAQEYAEANIRRICGVARQFFADAVERGLIDSNPFVVRDVPVASIANEDRQAYVSRETIDAVIAACPNAEWRLIVALSRYAGLRCPSEHLGLRWDEVNWETGRFIVHSPKTEHHANGAYRVVPIFRELRPYLEDAYELRGDSPYVISRYRDTNANLRTQLLRIMKRAGVPAWPKLFHALRASCQTDLTRIHPIKCVCDWIGNSVAIAAKHYLTTTDEDFERATQNPTQSVPVSGRQEPSLAKENGAKHWKSSISPRIGVPPVGVEPTT